MLEDQARDVGIVAGEHELREPPAHRFHRTEKVFEHVGVMDADLQHHAPRHSGCGVTPRAEVDLAKAIAADVGFGVDELAEDPRVDLAADPAEMALASALVAQGEDYSLLLAEFRDDAAFRNGIGDRFVEEYVLSRQRGCEGRLDVSVVRRGIDDRFDAGILQNHLVVRRRRATVLRGKGAALVLRACVAGDDPQLLRSLDRVGEDIRPPAHADAGDAQRLHLFGLRPYGFHRLPGDALAFDDDGAAAFHRGPALRSCSERESQRMREVEGLSLSAVRRGRTLVRRRAHRLGGGRVQRVEAPSVHALERDEMPARIGDRDRDRDPGLLRLRDGGVGYLLGPGVREAL